MSLTARRLQVVFGLVAWLLAGSAWAQPSDRGPGRELPDLSRSLESTEWVGRPVVRVELITVGGRWHQREALSRVRVGEPYSAELARRALGEILNTGRYANATAEVQPEAGGVVLRLLLLPRRLIAGVRTSGGAPDLDQALQAAGVVEGTEITAPDLDVIKEQLSAYYARRGYPKAKVRVDTLDTDAPLSVVLSVDVAVGDVLTVVDRRIQYWPWPALPLVQNLAEAYAVRVGDVADLEATAAADRDLADSLRALGFHRAEVSHELITEPAGARLLVSVRSGPRLRLKFENNRSFDDDTLRDALSLEERTDHVESILVETLQDFYQRHGFFDVHVSVERRGGDDDQINDLVFRVREGKRLRIESRIYPCLSGERSAADVSSEIDSFLSEELPGAELLGAVDPAVIDDTLGPPSRAGSEVAPQRFDPWSTYHPAVYERALKHLRDLYRSEGYLSAEVGPVSLMRDRCDRRSKPGECRPLPMPQPSHRYCVYDSIGRPAPLSDDGLVTCTSGRGHRCSDTAALYIPVRLGPRTQLFDISFEGNELLVEGDLIERIELELGEPVSQAELERARRQILEAYEDEGFAFAEVEVKLDLSPDQTRGRARFVIVERERVRVSRIVIRGATRTHETVIRSRIALEEGGWYERGLVRKTEERLATLGVFSSVAVGLQDPHVPAREKVVIVTVQERKSQYLEVRPGFSTGEGFRITFEYGHRNLMDSAIKFTLRSQLGILPNLLILEDDVRANYEELDLSERLERRNTAAVVFPDIGLGPLFRFSLEGVDVRDNARDFGLTKDAGIASLLFVPTSRVSAELAVSLELNDAQIFGGQALQDYIEEHPTERDAFRVPEGTTRAVAQRLGAAWDRRDNKLDATRGTLVSFSVEHVRADPVGEDAQRAAGESSDVFTPTTSEFLRYSNRIAGYLRLSDSGVAFAMSFRWGYIQQLFEESRTYPDRLFFLGGVDSLRGFLQDSLIPQDIAEQILSPTSDLTVREVVIRGGDAFVNPRFELRIPLGANLQTALFLDAGNLWRDPAHVDLLTLRYAAGTGIRVGTPIGPLVFDYGFNLDRVLDEVDKTRENQRFWEDLGAFHFSIGVF